MIARASDDYSGDIFIDAVTEDGGSVPCQLKEGYDDQGKAVAINGNKISGVEFKEGQSVRGGADIIAVLGKPIETTQPADASDEFEPIVGRQTPA